MLSIGKLGAGQADYYLSAVGQGIEDYYTGTGEAPGRWTGQATPELNLDGQVDGDQLRAVLNGNRPDGKGPLARTGRGKSRVPGFDLTFSAPKSVSVLFGLADPDISRAVRDTHEAAVDAALNYMERHAAVGRRGKGGAISVLGNGFLGAAFRHRTSRAGDPQLHTHVLVANLTRGPDNRWTALDARHLYAHARTGGFLYQAKLRLELTRRLGLEWTPVRNGVAEIDGIPKNVLRTFSRRRNEITDELAQRGETSAKAAQVAALHTRRDKDYAVPANELQARWRDQASQLDFPHERLDEVAARADLVPLTPDHARVGQDALASPAGLTQRRSSFNRRDVVRAWCERLRHGGDVNDIENLADDLIASDRAVPLAIDVQDRTTSDVVRRADGRIVTATTEERRYSTPELLTLEKQILDNAHTSRDQDRGRVTDSTRDQILAARPELSDEQRDMVARLITDGDGIAIVVGKAGTGKTYALDAARQAWQADGHQVLGAALARRAALELRDGAGIDATSIHALLHDLREHPGELLGPRSVLVIDEAGMVGTRQLAELIHHTEQAKAKLVLVGDPRQLPEIDAGGSFRALALRHDPIRLVGNRRQEHEWERETLELLRTGRADQALVRYHEHGRLTLADTAPELRQRLVTDWYTAANDDDSHAIMIALRRDDVTDLNQRARALMAADGRLGTELVTVAGRHFAVGDLAVCLQNHSGLGVTNGTHGTITAVHTGRGELTLTDRTGRSFHLTSDYLGSTTQRGGPTLGHGYALTGHKAQGLTVGHSFVLGSDALYREWGYVALSRGRHTNRLYLVASEPSDLTPEEHQRPASPLDETAAALTRSQAQTSATDIAGSAEIVATPTEVLERRLTQLRRDAQTDQRRARRNRALSDRTARVAGTPSSSRHEPPIPDYGADERAVIADELNRRHRANRIAITLEPPSYLVAELGPIPESPLERRTWRQRATAIETFRTRAGFSDPERALPDRVEPGQRDKLVGLRRELEAGQGAAVPTADSPTRGIRRGP